MKKLLFIVGIVLAAIAAVWFITRPSVYKASESQTQNTSSENQSNPETPNSSADSNNKTYTEGEVAAHNSENDCWTIIEGSVYNITSYVPIHPGGDEILRACGADGTSLFTTRTTEDGEKVGSGTPHSSDAHSKLESMKVGTLQSAN